MRTAGVLVLVAASGGCFYLDTVNLPPVAAIDRPPGPYFVHDTVMLSAVASRDDEPEPLRFDWSASCFNCLEEKGDKAQFLVHIDDHETRRVTVAVLDGHGATGTASVDLAVTDHDPTLKLQPDPPPNPDGTYPVGRPIGIAAQAEDADGDVTTLIAGVRPPPASDPNRTVFRSSGEATWTLTPDVAGHWEVLVTAKDAYGGKTNELQVLEVGSDTPPCIAATSPAALPDARYLLEPSDGPRRFAISTVTDDLDPWPSATTQLGFRWFVDGVEIAGHDLPDFTVDPADHLPGDTLALRVEIADRVARTLPCSGDQPQCSIGGDGCLQRVTWSLEIR